MKSGNKRVNLLKNGTSRVDARNHGLSLKKLPYEILNTQWTIL